MNADTHSTSVIPREHDDDGDVQIVLDHPNQDQELPPQRDSSAPVKEPTTPTVYKRWIPSRSTVFVILGVCLALGIGTFLAVFLTQKGGSAEEAQPPLDPGTPLESYQYGCVPTTQGEALIKALPFWIESNSTSIHNIPIDTQNTDLIPFTVVCSGQYIPLVQVRSVYNTTEGLVTWASSNCKWSSLMQRYQLTFQLSRAIIEDLPPGNYYINVQVSIFTPGQVDYTYDRAVDYNCSAGTFTKRDLWWEEFSLFGEDYWLPCQTAGGCDLYKVQYRELGCRSNHNGPTSEPLWENDSVCNGIPKPAQSERTSRQCDTKPECVAPRACLITAERPFGYCSAFAPPS